MGISAKWFRSLVGIRKQEKFHHPENDENVGNFFSFGLLSFNTSFKTIAL